MLLSRRARQFCSRFSAFTIIASFAVCLTVIGPARAVSPQGDQSLRFELPTNGNLRVENMRGGIILDVWKQSYVAITAINDSGQAKASPAVIQRTDGLLSVRVANNPRDNARINLTLRIPERTHAAMVTQDGAV